MSSRRNTSPRRMRAVAPGRMPVGSGPTSRTVCCASTNAMSAGTGAAWRTMRAACSNLSARHGANATRYLRSYRTAAPSAAPRRVWPSGWATRAAAPLWSIACLAMETIMRLVVLFSAAISAALVAAAPRPGQAQDLRSQIEEIVKDYLAGHPDEVGQIAKDYFVKHPEAVGQILAELLKHRVASTGGTGSVPPSISKPAVDRSSVVSSNAKLLFDSSHQVTLGNPHGKVTLVEFFDYNCGFCKRALPDTLALLKGDPDLKVVLKEFPILGPGSVEAARVAIAVRMQDGSGEKYLAFHKELLGNPGPASKEKALDVAKDQGLDIIRIEK